MASVSLPLCLRFLGYIPFPLVLSKFEKKYVHANQRCQESGNTVLYPLTLGIAWLWDCTWRSYLTPALGERRLVDNRLLSQLAVDAWT